MITLDNTLDVRSLRRRLSAMILALAREKWSAETTLAYRSLQMAKAHLGKALGEMGTPDPYAHAAAKRQIQGTRDIPEEAERAEEPFPLTGDRLRDTDALRSEIGGVLGDVRRLFREVAETSASGVVFDYLTWSEQHLIEARFWLGYELGRLRDVA